MVTLTADEAAVYDGLAILYVKQEKLRSAYQKGNLYGEIDSTINALVAAHGGDKHVQVLNSPEFHKLKESNAEVFDLVDKAARDEVKASAVVEANLRRYNCKRDLQFVHFNRPLTEVKG